MRSAVFTAFADFVAGTTPVYTAESLNDPLAIPDQLSVQTVCDQVTASGTTPLLVCAVETSGDGRNWVQKNSTPEINNVALSASTTNVAFGADPGTTPSLAFVRLRFQLVSSSNSVGAHIKAHVCGRDNG